MVTHSGEEGHVDVDGCVNFRDAGEWPATGGRMRTGRLFRSDDPIRLRSDGRSTVERLGFAAAIDLRQHAQFVRRPGFVEPARTAHRPLVDRVIDLDDPPLLTAPAHLADMYEEMISRSTPQIAEVLDLLATRLLDGPVLVHCAYGKDRTGVIVALVQIALGVSDADIATEYGRSHAPTLRRYRWMLAEPLHDDPPIHRAPPFLFSAPTESMAILLERMAEAHGSLDAWLASFPTATSTPDLLRASLIEP